MTTDTEALQAVPATSAGALRDLAPALVLTFGGLAALLGALCLATTRLEAYPAPLLALLGLALVSLVAQVRREGGARDRRLVSLAVLAIPAALLLATLPSYITGLQLNAILHRSLVSAILLLALGVPAVSAGLYYLYGATPRAEDLARYPLLLAPALLALAAYGLLLTRILRDGLAHLHLAALTTPYRVLHWREVVWADGWPTWIEKTLTEVGMRNHILGTLLLVALTALIATPIGVAVGVFVSEFGPPRLVRVVRTTTALLRATSAFVLALLAISLVRGSTGTWLSELLRGFHVTVTGVHRAGGGSFLLAAAVIALLVIPVIARATEDGCRALPQELREGSWSLGASESYTLRRIVLPWALPNVITGVVLASAEAAGSLAVILFMVGSGDFGVGPLREVTSLTYVVFGAQYGVSKAFRNAMLPYQYSAAVVLLAITVGLTLIALALKRHYGRRYLGR